MYISTTNGKGVCSCSCCIGIDCTPTHEGNVEVPSCDDLICYDACEKSYPSKCDSSKPGLIDAFCDEIITTTLTTSSSSTTTFSTSSSTSTITDTTSNTTVTVPTTSSPQSSSTSTTTNAPTISYFYSDIMITSIYITHLDL
ncbi:unnamed protein product [Rotaria sp. Silwood1]|nr:unnamed protein product [Rotaria sp. Silwood1]CAF1404861.1 unnamed protein product [Rotaria sp. Silwood1]CAF1408159.1 unnamed protein product [Rotaria sp. Silwood1]CAF3561109.1 unnamed protein product [Rotaria sp. Silwood1]CAF3569057.1 unnamed protein product [Rotaria sp. Silwood1]